MKKITFVQLQELNHWNKAVLVFSKDSFDREYNEIERSYKVSSDEKYFDSNMNGSSLFGNCLDGKDDGVRLDIYISDGWIVDYCYIVE